ncbi:MAG TPA: hypothetical protein VHY37_03905, partial [Tepidisphaeraceae bacterium]|nr:hypothetical protein [Tepidisphaeraceae bacterium]
MHSITIQSEYYQQFDIDTSRQVPAEGAGGWKKAPPVFDRDRMALAVMHAVDCQTPQELPWLHRSTEYLGRADRIARSVFEPLLAAVRGVGMRVYHVVPGGIDVQGHPGYQRAIRLAGPKPKRPRIEVADPLMAEIRKFRDANVMPGANNYPPTDRVGKIELTILKQAWPVGEEGIAETSEQLFALCQDDGINHLVYCGFTINVCIQTAPGGMVFMNRAGLMCSAIR